jgi:hyperosmotically inducible protein
MKTRSISKAVAGLLFVAALGGCASTHKQESAGEYVDDTVITTKVKAVILDNKFTNGLDVNVETYKGVVQLSGFVKGAAEHDKAIELARSVNGVRSVKDDIVVR